MDFDNTRLHDEITRALLGWFQSHQRTLPWRSEPSPYRVWISEIMLQQTQVVTVIPYFLRWMEVFPDLQSLAAAELDDVLALWSGLGYYRRARMLHRAAQTLVSAGTLELPGTVPELLKLPGIGRYTAGAIASIAFNQPAPIVDGNVIRVLCRLFAIDGDPRSTPVQKILWALAEALVPADAPGDFNQSMMELGATVCTPKGQPSCLLCPLQAHCLARRQGRIDELPQSKKRPPKRAISLAAAILTREEDRHLLLFKRPEEGLFGGLWDLPSAEFVAEQDPQSVLLESLSPLGLELSSIKPEAPLVHLLTHIRLTVHPFVIQGATVNSLASSKLPSRWAALDVLEGVALSAVSRKLITRYASAS